MPAETLPPEVVTMLVTYAASCLALGATARACSMQRPPARASADHARVDPDEDTEVTVRPRLMVRVRG